MKKAKTWLQVLLFFVIVAVAVMIYIVPTLGHTAPGGPKLSFGGTETCRLGDALEDFNAAGFYMSQEVQDQTYTGLRSVDNLRVYLDAGRTQSCGDGQLVNKGDKWLKGVECMVYSFKLNWEDGGHMACDGTEILGNTKDAIQAALGQPKKSYSDSDVHSFSRGGRTYNFRVYYDETDTCTAVSAYQVDPKLSFRST